MDLNNIDLSKIPYLSYNNTGARIKNKKVPYAGLFWDEKEVQAIVNSVLNGKWFVAGEKVREFELKFSRMFGVKHSHMVNSGSSANLVMISALKKRFKWKDGAEIIVSPVGFPTTIAPIVQNKLKPVFVDIEFDTLNFDVTKISSVITDDTVAIFVSPVLGNPPDMSYLQYLCTESGILLLGDNCDSMGTTWEGEHLSQFYYASSHSFYPAHHISTGEGGMVCTNDTELYKLFISFSWWGRDCYCVGAENLLSCGTCGNRFSNWIDGYDGQVDHKYVFTSMGYNLKPLDLQGAIGIEQLKKFNTISKNRKRSKEIITKIFLDYFGDEISEPESFIIANVCWFATPFICKTKELKHALVAHLESHGIQTRNYFAGNILQQPAYKHLGNYLDFPNSNTVLDTVFFIGASPLYNNDTFEYIKTVVEKFKK